MHAYSSSRKAKARQSKFALNPTDEGATTATTSMTNKTGVARTSVADQPIIMSSSATTTNMSTSSPFAIYHSIPSSVPLPNAMSSVIYSSTFTSILLRLNFPLEHADEFSQAATPMMVEEATMAMVVKVQGMCDIWLSQKI